MPQQLMKCATFVNMLQHLLQHLLTFYNISVTNVAHFVNNLLTCSQHFVKNILGFQIVSTFCKIVNKYVKM